jgi:hypothetical protein
MRHVLMLTTTGEKIASAEPSRVKERKGKKKKKKKKIKPQNPGAALQSMLGMLRGARICPRSAQVLGLKQGGATKVIQPA